MLAARPALPVVLGALVALPAALPSARLLAQEAEWRPAPRTGEVTWRAEPPRPRLGLYLDPLCAPADPDGACARPPVVVGLVEDGPARRAGVERSDTLLALGGQSLSTSEGRRALQSLSAGEPVTLLLGGPEGRREVEVTPEVRSGGQQMRFEWRSPAPGGGERHVNVFRFPAPEAVEELRVRLDTLPDAPAGRGFVVIRPDAEARLRIEIAESDSFVVRARPPAPGAPAAGSPAAGTWVVSSGELARRLEKVRDRTLRVARVHFDSLARLRGGVVVPAPRAEFGRGRIAGAELRDLTPELGEYFGGRSEGLLVLRVIPDTPAGRLGLRGGDVVVEVNGDPVRSSEEFRRAILSGPAEEANVKWIRKGDAMEGRLGVP